MARMIKNHIKRVLRNAGIEEVDKITENLEDGIVYNTSDVLSNELDSILHSQLYDEWLERRAKLGLI